MIKNASECMRMPIECQSLKLDLKSLWKAGLIFNPFAPVASCHGNSPVAGLAQSWAGLLLKAAITPWVRIATAFSMSWKDEAYRLVNGEGDGLSGLIAKHLMAKLFEQARTITWEQNRATQGWCLWMHRSGTSSSLLGLELRLVWKS